MRPMKSPAQKWLNSFKSSKSQVPVQMKVQMKVQIKVQMKIQSPNQAIKRDTKTQLELQICYFELGLKQKPRNKK